uniref:Thioredoxin domain-containing protein n=1 Tax=Romanomermis culicivorax TaxID=13658 RepID=A0A915JRB3_ROMCU
MAVSLKYFQPSIIRQILLVLIASSPTFTKVIPLDSSTFDQSIENAQIAVVNFYANWCRFSQLLEPTFKEASEHFENNTNVVFGGVDCDQKQMLSGTRIRKTRLVPGPDPKIFETYPVFEPETRPEINRPFYRNGTGYILEVLEPDLDPNPEQDPKLPDYFVGSGPDISKICYRCVPYPDPKQDRKLTDYFIGSGPGLADLARRFNVNKYPTLKYFRFGQLSKREYRGSRSVESLISFVDENLAQIFENIDSKQKFESEMTKELTEEGIPFLILFRKSDDKEILELFTQHVASELHDQKAKNSQISLVNRIFWPKIINFDVNLC